jgi:8-oxo-dGTP pyrophosphatase MutT (NUDIX family)
MTNVEVAGDAAGVLGRALARHEPLIRVGGRWRASVALVLRWTSKPPVGEDDATVVPVRGFLARHARRLELLFIQRAASERDPFSGHVAFPGGRRDASDEDDLACAIRETSEEVGIDLTASRHFSLLGRLDDTLIPTARHAGKGKSKDQPVLCAFAFLQSHENPPNHCTLNPTEVAAALWVPVTCLLRGSSVRISHTYVLKSRHMGLVGAMVPRRILEVLGLTRVRYVAVDVFAVATEVIYAEDSSHATPPDEASLVLPPVVEPIEPDMGPVLWGLTMRAASDMVAICGGRRLDTPPFVFENKVVAVFARIVYFAVSRLSWFSRLRFRKRHLRVAAQ